jgi:hypothetical protein
VTLSGSICPPFQEDFKIIIDCGSGQSPPYKAILSCEKDQISTLYEEFIYKTGKNILTKEDRHNFVRMVFGSVEEKKIADSIQNKESK